MLQLFFMTIAYGSIAVQSLFALYIAARFIIGKVRRPQVEDLIIVDKDGVEMEEVV